mmetsp:Transcript_63947/g.129892  ORF Transcript_63947/g.129892 Transcript_63947/m.129892 type:complete len:109 (-) Transcript_63947:1924-2250(-)
MVCCGHMCYQVRTLGLQHVPGSSRIQLHGGIGLLQKLRAPWASVWLMVLDCWFKTSAKQLAALIVLLAANPHQCRMLTERHLSALHAHQGFLKKTRSPLHANHAGREL